VTLRLETHGAIAHLIIDRAVKRNAFNQAMWDALPGLVAQAMADDKVRVLVLRSAEPGMFCAGADISELSTNADNPDWLLANQTAINRAQYDLTRAAKPTIALIDGDCVGGGCGLALACDLRVASARSRFGITPAKLGLVYPLHDTKLLVDLVGPANAKRILFTGTLIDAAEAHRIGLIDEVANNADALIETMTSVSRHSQRESKAMIRRVLDGQVADDDATRAVFADAFSGADFREGVSAFLEKRPPHFRSG
jgi:enoyl-CoA hydratase/carnithine racemase